MQARFPAALSSVMSRAVIVPHEHRAGHADPARRQPQSDVRADDSALHECHRELMLLARRVPGSTMIRADSAANSGQLLHPTTCV